MTTLATSLQRLHRHVVIKTRANIHELFDANKYGEQLLLPEFVFEFSDPTGNLEFSFHLNRDTWLPRTEEKLRGRVLCCEPLGQEPNPGTGLPRYWRIKVRFLVKFSESDERTYHSFAQRVETMIDYDSHAKTAKLHDTRFCRKFTRWLDERDGVPGGLYFNGRRIARVAEPKPPWEQNKDLPFGELKVDVQTYNVFGRMFQYGTAGDVAKFLDDHSEEEVRRIPGIGLGRIAAMKQELRRLGWKPKK